MLASSMLVLLMTLCSVARAATVVPAAVTDEERARARQFLAEYEERADAINYESSIKAWAYYTNITDYNSDVMVAFEAVEANFTKEMSARAHTFNFKNYTVDLRRQFESIAEQGTDAMKNHTKLKRLSTVLSQMEGIYGKGQVCGVAPDYDCLDLEPDLTRILAEERDYKKLAIVWKRWRDVSKGKMKTLYQEFVELSNEALTDGGHADTGEYWRSWYESDTFEADLQALLEDLKPLYNSLHAYVRKKLKEHYGAQWFPASGHIPAHLFGNMWSQSWINIYDLVEPFPGRESIDITPVLKERNYTALQMFKTAESFFTSLGLRAMSEEFWNYSMIEKPDDRDVVCHASAWDFSHGNDTRIKMCTDLTMDDLITVHHEMGHIQYYLQYQGQPSVFRGGANPGFHEAIGDVMALSVSTPKHLHAIGLLDTVEDNHEADINFLMRQALDKVSFLPFGYLIDQWRWSVFRGDTPPEKYNSDWWKLRCQYQGIAPPVTRSEDDFDPGAKYHIPGNTPYIRYFVSFVIQFQFHKALCEAANQTGPLYQCDIYQSKEAGDKLRTLLMTGASKPWTEVMKEITGSPNMSTGPIKEYFEPLIKWLNDNTDEKERGWEESTCPEVTFDADEEEEANKWLEEYDRLASDMLYRVTIAQWNYGANLTDHNQEIMVNLGLEKSDFDKKMYKIANSFPWKDFTNKTTIRQFEKITNIGTSALDDKDQLKQMADLQAHIEGIYGKAKVKMSDGRELLLEPGLTEILSTSRDYAELKEAWVKWREVSGQLMKTDYAKFVELSNKAVQALDFSDTGEVWRDMYESDTFEADLEKLLTELQPLYSLLHAYVRKQLKSVYGDDNFPRSGHIPAHLLGNMWAQQWNNIYDLVEPYKNAEAIDVTTEMVRQNYTVWQMFETAEDFFKSLGLLPMPEEFWNKTIMVNPEGVTMVCHASAWDFYNQEDFRIKMCTEVNMEELITIHHEMGHIQYFLQYKDQPVVFREGANPGFHEAIGDVMGLSVSTPKHLRSIGLLKNDQDNHEGEINFLMKIALQKIAFLPFGYLIDQWRWSVFSGETTPQDYNQKWWQLRCDYQGISPPVERSENDFDPGAKYHIPANVPYIRYFVSFVVQFQFHKSLCEAAGHTGPLHKCDIYNSKQAGVKLQALLKSGSSAPWPEAMIGMTGFDKMQVAPLIEYFKPLSDWLELQVPVEERGWSKNPGACSHVTEGDEVDAWLDKYDQEAARENYFNQQADWEYNTNINNDTEQARMDAAVQFSQFQKEVAANVSQFDYKRYADESRARMLAKIADIGTDALKDQQQVEDLQKLKSQMESIYSKGEVCTERLGCLKLEPGLTEIMSSSRDSDELLEAWHGWRNNTGRLMPELYEQYVTLSNRAVQELGYKDTGDYWRHTYQTTNFQAKLERLLWQLQPLYQSVHTYIRSKLIGVYGDGIFPKSGHIPAHILGNMWAQDWGNLYDIAIPFKNKPSVDVTPALKQKGYNSTELFRLAERFFTSLGLEPMSKDFWEKSMLKRPEGDREVVCHASAWDFSNGTDFRIKMCTRVDMDDMVTIHHEMGHIQYFMQYRNLPIAFRDGANPGFHEAIGDVIALSVTSPKHLRKIGLLPDGPDDYESDINFLMKMALDKVAFLPFGYLIDQWRWRVFSGDITPETYNEEWWNLRCKFQGISPPVSRGTGDFDPGAKFHIPANYQYIAYFVSYVIQFQFHKALCEAANQTGPLYQCDIYQSKAAGDKLMAMLEMGSSKPWQEAMQVLTGQRDIDATPILDYFKPLMDWLEVQNRNIRPGWTTACPEPPRHPGVFSFNHNQANGAGSTYRMAQISVVFLLFIVLLSLR